MMTHVRHAAVAGLFYPDNPRELDGVVRRLLADAETKTFEDSTPKAIIAPHAGYVYSGPIAASAYARLRPAAAEIRRIVLIGPCHRVPVRGIAVSSADAFTTPLGTVPVDKAAVAEILCLPQVELFDATHADEHCLEVHLPFLQEVLGPFAIVPLVAGHATAEEVAEVLERLWGGPETRIVVSSDLSHYLDYDSARRTDAATCRAIETLNPAAIGYDQACGRVPVIGLLTLARRHGLKVTTLDVRNSGDTAGDRRRVVGYGAWMFTESKSAARQPDPSEQHKQPDFGARTRRLLDRHGETLLHLAAASIEHGLNYGRPLPAIAADHAAELRTDGASFVTLKREGRLRGCIGSAQAHRPLVDDVVANGFAAAFQDTRFGPLRRDELPGLRLSVSVLSLPDPSAFADERSLLAGLRPGADGLIIESNGHRALFLPQVWEALPEPKAFLTQLKTKAGLSPDHWSTDFKAWRFVAEAVSSDSLADPDSLWS